MAGFRIFLPNAFYGFSGFAKEVPPPPLPRSHAKTVIPSFRGTLDKPTSLFSSRYFACNGCQADYEKLEMTSSKRLFLKYHAARKISCGL